MPWRPWSPLSISSRACSSCCGVSLRLRPNFTPRCLAAFTPARVRSLINGQGFVPDSGNAYNLRCARAVGVHTGRGCLAGGAITRSWSSHFRQDYNLPIYAGGMQSYNEVFGTTNNPHNMSRTPGGLSGGSAAALACGFTPRRTGQRSGGFD